VAAFALGAAALGALAGVVVVHRSPSGYRASAVLLGERGAAPTARVAYVAGVLTGAQDPLRHVHVQAREQPTRLVVTNTQLTDASAIITADAVVEAYAWQSAAARWRAAGTLAIGDFEAGTDDWGLTPPLLVVPPGAVGRYPSGAGRSHGSLAFTCAGAAACGTWRQLFASFRRGGSYRVSAELRAPAERARLIVGVPGDRASSTVVSGKAWTRVAVTWHPHADEPSAEVAVSGSGLGRVVFVDRVRIVDQSIRSGGIAPFPAERLSNGATALYTSWATGLVIGAFCGLLIAAGGIVSSVLALRVRDGEREAEQQPNA
jgi:hypothetical protein